MRATRFSIGSLLAVIGILGVALAALRNPSYLWATAAFTAALAAVVAAVVNTVLGRGARRAYWLGFALFGGTYLLILSMPALRDSVCPRIVTEAILDVIYPFMAPDAPQPASPFTIAAMIN
jgi:drug/metabolite transporter (DMT)-like permease